jgi:hypothetical protein
MKRRTPARPAPAKGARREDRAKRVAPMKRAELDALRAEVRRKKGAAARWNADPEDVQKSVAQLVLSLVEFLRKLLERQAIRRMDAGTLSDDQVEAIGLALMKLEEAVRDIAARFGIPPEELNLDLGPLGRLH